MNHYLKKLDGMQTNRFNNVLSAASQSCAKSGQIAQSVEQRIENPCVGGSIPPLATTTMSKAASLCSPKNPGIHRHIYYPTLSR